MTCDYIIKSFFLLSFLLPTADLDSFLSFLSLKAMANSRRKLLQVVTCTPRLNHTGTKVLFDVRKDCHFSMAGMKNCVD